MGESIAEGTITKWLKEVGDKVDRDEALLEISTDKVDTEIPSPAAGILGKLLTEEGATVEVGTEIAIILAEGEEMDDVDESALEAKEAPAEDGEAQDGDDSGDDEKKQAEKERKDKKKEREKKKRERRKEPARAKAKSSSSSDGSSSRAATAVATKTNGGPIPRMSHGRFYSPLVRNIAESEGLSVGELDSIDGSGAEGRVTKDDVLTYLEERPAGGAAAGAPVFGEVQEDRVVPMDRMRQVIAHHMVESIQTAAHVYIMTEADVTDLVAFRAQHKEPFRERTGEKLTYTPFFVKASALALRDFPFVNSQVNPEDKEVTLKGAVNVGMAVAVPREDGSFGLIVPVIRNADMLPLREIARQVNDLAARGREGTLAAEEPQGGTFTVTNMGVFGSYGGLPIINQPQVAILGLGAIQKRPAVVDGELAVRDQVFLSVGIDHRLVDGALGGQFLERIRYYLENVDSWLLA